MHQAEVLSAIPADSAELGRGRRPMTCTDQPHSRLNGTHESEAIDMSLNQDQKQSTAAHHHQRIKSSSSALSLLAKYGLTDIDHDDGTSNMYGHKLGQHIIEHDHANNIEHFADDGEIMLLNHDQINGSTCRLPLHEKYNYFASHNVDDSQHDRHAQQYTAGGVNEARSHHNIQAASGDHHRKKGGSIATSALQAAQAQAAELRALHSAVVKGLAPDMQNGMMAQRPLHTDDHLAHFKSRANKKRSKVQNKFGEAREQNEDVRAAMSSASSASSTVDCFINPVREYPVFMSHSQEDILLNTLVDDENFLNRRSSVDTYEAAMREERLQYIFDHDNKRSFSRLQFDDHSARNGVSCLHESLNLPPRSATSLVHLQSKDDHSLHHKSLNLPQGSQHHLFNMQNPLFDHNSMHINKKSSVHHNDGSIYSPSFKRYNDHELPSKPIQGNKADKYSNAQEGKAFQGFTSKQRALLEFLSEEPARIRAFNELAAKEATPSNDVYPSSAVPKQKISIHENNPPPRSVKLTGKFESSTKGDQLMQGGSDQNHHHHQSTHELPTIASVPLMRQRLSHTSSTGNLHRTSTVPGVSWDKCRPAGGIPTVVVPLTDSRELSIINAPASAVGREHTKEIKPDQKKSFIKDWFFRGKKKQSNADHPNVPAIPASVPTSEDRSPIVSGTFSTAPREPRHSGPYTTSATHGTSSLVFSGLATSDAEKELEVAMAMDLMELKVLQANTKRDAAMAEVLELRLAMDSMGKKLVEVERHCESLRTQLMDVQALRKRPLGGKHRGADGTITAANPENVDLWMHRSNASDGDDDEVAEGAELHDHGGATTSGVTDDEEDDYCESDSHDNREERKAAARMIRAGRADIMKSSGYGGAVTRSTGRGMLQPKKEEFLSAVAEARVGVRQMSRVLLQHVEEIMMGSARRGTGYLAIEGAAGEAISAGGGEAGIAEQLVAAPAHGVLGDAGAAEKETWGPILMMCREARRAASGRPSTASSSGGGGSTLREVGYCIEALLSMAFYEHFENVGFDKSGAHKILDPAHRALAFYHSFLKLAQLTATQLLTQPSSLYNPAFDRFCSRKMRTLGRAVGCPGKLWPDELARAFLSAARAIWLLHELAFAYPTCPAPPCIFRVAAHSPFEPGFMELLPARHHHHAHASHQQHLVVSLMVMPGFFLGDDVIKSKVLA